MISNEEKEIVLIRHKQNLNFDLSHHIKMNGTGFSNNTTTIQSGPIPLKNFLFVKIMNDISRMDQ
jgi:hypothetical protein